jgi:hypothetical protein
MDELKLVAGLSLVVELHVDERNESFCDIMSHDVYGSGAEG